MISNIPTSACEEHNLFYTPYIPRKTPIQVIYLWDDSPNLKEFLDMAMSANVCVTTNGVFVLLHKINVRTWVNCTWLNNKGKVTKKKYEIA